MQGFVELLRPWLAPEGAAQVGATETLAGGARFEGMAALVQARATGVVGREELFRVLDVAAASGLGRVVLVTGPAGAGKTAALSAYASRGDAGRAPAVSAVHLVSPDLGRDDPRLIAQALLAELCARFDLRRAIPEDYGSAIAALHAALRDLGASSKRVVVVIDGVDDVRSGPAGTPELAFIPRAAMRGVVWVVSARPGSAVESIKFERGVQTIELAPLAKEPLLALARKLGEGRPDAFLERAVEHVKGNPLFLKALLEAPADATIAANLEAAFRSLLDRAAQSAGVDAARVLGLLAVARSGLTRGDLTAMLGESPLAMTALARELRPWLDARGGRQVLFHERLRDWVLKEVLDAPARAVKLHGDVAERLAAQSLTGRSDALADLALHLEAAGRPTELLTLLDGEHPRRVALAAGSVESLREDLLRGVRASGDDLARAARYALTAALATRGGRELARTGATAALARRGDPRVPASLARLLPEGEERDRVLGDVAAAVAARDPAYAAAVADEVADPARREALLARLKVAVTVPPPANAAEDARAMAVEALGALERNIRVHAVVAAARGLPLDAAKKLLARAATEAVGAPSHDEAAELVLVVVRALAKVDAAEAVKLASGLPRGVARVQAIAAAGDGAQALFEADGLPAGEARSSAMAYALEEMARTDAKEVIRSGHLKEIKGDAEKDRVHLEIVRATKGILLASKMVDPALRAEAFALAGEWDEADPAVASIEAPAARATALDKLATVAREAGDAARAAKLEAEATHLLDALPAAERAAAWRQVVVASGTSAGRAKLALERARAESTTYEGARDTALAAARLALRAPGGKPRRRRSSRPLRSTTRSRISSPSYARRSPRGSGPRTPRSWTRCSRRWSGRAARPARCSRPASRGLPGRPAKRRRRRRRRSRPTSCARWPRRRGGRSRSRPRPRRRRNPQRRPSRSTTRGTTTPHRGPREIRAPSAARRGPRP